MNAPFTAVHFTTYETAKRALFEISPEKVVVHAIVGAAAGALAAVSTRSCQDKTSVSRSLRLGQICDEFDRESDRECGEERWLMSGWVPRMLYYAPAAAICWSIYVASKSFQTTP